MTQLLVVYASQTGRTRQLADAAVAGARDGADDVRTDLLHGLEAGVDELMACDGLLIATPENFGYMSGAIKDFLDRTYYPCEGRRVGLPYALIVSAGNDGSGAVRSIERIATGFGWKAAAEPLIVVGEPSDEAIHQASVIGQTLAAGLSLGVL